MKKFKNFSILILTFLIVLFNNKVYAQTGVVQGNNVRLRVDADTKAEILTNLKKGEEVEILGEKENFYNVQYKSFNGFASKDYIEVKQTEVENQETQTTEAVEENVTEESNVLEENNILAEEQSNEIEKLNNLEGKEISTINIAILRLKPNSASKSLIEIPVQTNLKINKQLGNWVQINFDNKTGWINKSALEQENNSIVGTESSKAEEVKEEIKEEVIQPTEKVEEEKLSSGIAIGTKGYVNADTVNVREGASTESKRLGFLDLNNEVEIIGEEGDWYKIKTQAYGECYIAKRLISLTQITSRGTTFERDALVSNEANSALTSILNTSSNSGEEIVNFAKQYLGYSYVYGGKKPETGFDCSGFTKYVYSNFGIELGATAASQASSGTEVAREDLQVGDLILFQNDSKTCIGHCAIYIGNNTFIHAANPKRGVVTDVLDGNSYYSPRFVTARRF